MFNRIRNFFNRLAPNKAKSKFSSAINRLKGSSRKEQKAVQKENQQMERIFNNLDVDLEVETGEARIAKSSELEWANELDNGNFNRHNIPESVLEKLEQKNENWDGSEMVTVKREILLKAIKEDVQRQDPFRANRSRLRQNEPKRQQYSVEDDDFDIDNIPF